ncbi:MAG: sulfotransferase [Actinoplanes sp.]
MPSDRPIFVVGCPRSGTTMLQLMLHAHPRIAIPPETRFLLDAYRRRHEFGDLTDAGRRRELAHWITGTPQFGDLGLDPAAVADAIVAAPPTLGSGLGTVFRLYADRFGKPRWGDKRPAYLRHVPQLRRLFPDAQFINIMRDGRDCVASLKETPWRPPDFGELIDHWARSADASMRAEREYGPDVYHQVRYEDLVADPEKYLRAVCRFLGEDYDPAMARPDEVARVAVPSYKKWHTRTHAAVGTDRVSSWPERLTPAEVEECEAVFGSRLARFGYQPSTRVRRTPRVFAVRGWLTARDRLTPVRTAAEDARYLVRHGHREPSVAARLTAAERMTTG